MTAVSPCSPRLTYRALHAANLGEFHELVRDEHVRRYLLDGKEVPFTWCEEILASISAERAKSGLGIWLVFAGEGGPALGFAGYHRFEGLKSPLQLFYALRASFTKKGYAREAAVALIDFARERRALPDIVAAVDAPNVASIHVLERLGFRETENVPGAFGRLRNSCLPRGLPPRERRTARLVLRPFRETDRDAFARLNADPRVMEYFPKPLTREESDVTFRRVTEELASRGFAPWALELASTGEFVGAAGLAVPGFESHFTPCVEIAWRLAPDHWGRGYAQEAARAALYDAFVHLELERIVAFTAFENQRSRNVMMRLGMQHDPIDDFDHPSLPHAHPLSRHVLYRMYRSGWQANRARSSSDPHLW